MACLLNLSMVAFIEQRFLSLMKFMVCLFGLVVKKSSPYIWLHKKYFKKPTKEYEIGATLDNLR